MSTVSPVAGASFVIEAAANRTKDWLVSLFEKDGVTPAVAQIDDAFRFKIAPKSNPSAVLYDLDQSPTPAGSIVNIVSYNPLQLQVRLAQDDSETLAGAYLGELVWIDSTTINPSNAARQVQMGALNVTASLGGAVTP